MNNVLKIAICGSSKVGKSNLRALLSKENIDDVYNKTIGVEYSARQLNPTTKLIFWDISGDPKFENLTEPYVDNIDILILMYDIYDRHTVDRVGYLQSKYRTNAHTIIVGNSYNPRNKTIQYIEECKHLASNVDGEFILVNTNTSENIDILLNSIKQRIDNCSNTVDSTSQYLYRNICNII